MMTDPEVLPAQAGHRLARGVARMLRGMGHATLLEFCPAPGLRVDVVSLAPDGDLWITECKSCRADFMGDRKWQGYLEWSDRFFWAVDCDFPVQLLPDDAGLMVADAYGADISRMPIRTPLAAARRKRLTADFARCGAFRLQGLLDPHGTLAASG